MSSDFVEKSIEISAPVSKVWRVVMDPVLTRPIVGSSFSWKALNGQVLTNGTILNIEPEEFLPHKRFDSDVSSIKSIISVTTYEFQEPNRVTTIRAREDFSGAVSDEESTAAIEGWDAGLQAVKEIAESES